MYWPANKAKKRTKRCFVLCVFSNTRMYFHVAHLGPCRSLPAIDRRLSREALAMPPSVRPPTRIKFPASERASSSSLNGRATHYCCSHKDCGVTCSFVWRPKHLFLRESFLSNEMDFVRLIETWAGTGECNAMLELLYRLIYSFPPAYSSSGHKVSYLSKEAQTSLSRHFVQLFRRIPRWYTGPSMSWVFLGALSQWDMPGTTHQEGIQVTSSQDARGSCQFRGAVSPSQKTAFHLNSNGEAGHPALETYSSQDLIFVVMTHSSWPQVSVGK